jgi:hypothetical protein
MLHPSSAVMEALHYTIVPSHSLNWYNTMIEHMLEHGAMIGEISYNEVNNYSNDI